MEVYRLDKAIDNENKDLELAIGKLKKALVVQMNDNLYTKERIEDIYPEKNVDEVVGEIKDLLENNFNLQGEIKKKKRKQEIHLVRLCEVMEEKDKAKEEIEEKNNEIQQLSLRQEDFIDQLTNANEEIMNI